jgi:hypothetical protein
MKIFAGVVSKIVGIGTLVSTMTTSSQEKFAKFFRSHDLLGSVWFEPLSLLLCVKLVFVLHHMLRLLELLLPHFERLLTKGLLLNIAYPLFVDLILLKILLLKVFRPLELLSIALSKPLRLIPSLPLIRVPLSIAAIAIIVARTR